jgi:predicted enzyme related to lactoylglutathione lyase
MSQIVWWEIETPEPEVFQGFHGALWGWAFEPAFVDSELGADYWIIKADDQGIGGLQRSTSRARPQAGSRLYVEVADLERVLGEVRARGGKVATALDPTGVSFGMWTAHPPVP